MMNSKFTDEQIKAYASNFREGDAIWVNGKWCEVVGYGRFGRLATKAEETLNDFLVNLGEDDGFEGAINGFRGDKSVHNRFRVTTLSDYKLQGGEKIVWLGESDDFRTFGKVYKTEDINNFTCDKGYMGWGVSGLYWGIIPRYEQVENFGKEDDEVSEIKVVEESNYTGKFKLGDEVKVVALTKLEDAEGLTEFLFCKGEVVSKDASDEYSYRVSFGNGDYNWFSESTLELVNPKTNEIKRNEERPASSHYHIDNNGNDVWQFADDNLSDERVKGFHQINAIKYVARYEKKHETAEKRIEDLEKAKVSIDKLIELEGLE